MKILHRPHDPSYTSCTKKRLQRVRKFVVTRVLVEFELIKIFMILKDRSILLKEKKMMTEGKDNRKMYVDSIDWFSLCENMSII